MKHWMLLAMLLASCRAETAAMPEPVALTAEATGHFCQMTLVEHPGPKAQVHLADVLHPLFFSQVRDAIAYQRLPEQSHDILGIYVSDMGGATWEQPDPEAWVRADLAHYVVGSSRVGGMGAAEAVPFSDPDDARAFAARWGGEIRRLDEIGDHEVLAPPEAPREDPADDGDYAARLQALAGAGTGTDAHASGGPRP